VGVIKGLQPEWEKKHIWIFPSFSRSKLDRFWANEEIYYNHKANISCTGSRSNYDVALE